MVTNNMAQVLHVFDKCFMCFTNILRMSATSMKGKKVLRKHSEFTPQKPYLKNFSGAGYPPAVRDTGFTHVLGS